MLGKNIRKNGKETGDRASHRIMGRPELKILRRRHRYCQKIWMVAGLLILSVFMQILITSAQQSRIQQGIAKEVLRFHVLANSDSEEDQAVKLQVRDAVLMWMEGALKGAEEDISGKERQEVLWKEISEERDIKLLKGTEEPSYIENETKISTNNAKDDLKIEEITGKKVPDRNEILQFIQNHLPEIEAVANQTLVGQHQSYRATAAIQTIYFPERTYGTCTFPAGWYEALRIRLGEAKGHNWWCVLYPRLCFTDCLHAVVEEEGQQELKKVLTEEEYETLLHEPEQWKIRMRWLGK